MAKRVKKNAVCVKCGADVREGTAFCYNCGEKLTAASVVEEIPTAKEKPPVEKKVDEAAATTSEDKLSRAAEQRRKARVSQRRSNEYTWEPTPDSPLVMIVAVLIAAVALAIVIVTVYWK